MCGDGCAACSVRGSTPCCSASTILITPPTPAAACVCPRFDFRLPSHSGRSRRARSPVRRQQRLRLDRIAQRRARAVRLHRVDVRRRRAAPLASACPITSSCAGPFGAVRPWLRPSWLTAEPRTTASTGWPLRRASDSRSSSSTPAPSLQPAPSAAAENALHRPSGASPRWRLNVTNGAGVAITVTPPASASAHSPWRSACAARWIATSDELHAVSTVIAGPCSPSVYAMRPDATLAAAAGRGRSPRGRRGASRSRVA